MFASGFETWISVTGRNIEVTVLYRYLSIADVCPRCEGGIGVAVGRTQEGIQLYRLECAACGWTTEAVPDPEAQ